ncbi:hypothetical protein PV08_11599 [Exophiala spinifera]|uniref:Uncharacterized protein n=1 Tax=Exophiala spinifera TaxID=91928 RepID=A0A0D2AW03_9EURO|nr:uncharacterized protein PV08_11599 [Exophiala spinifera]KIW10635.1 hypothetical protein PV08_11599 [Exophiala spinifera]
MQLINTDTLRLEEFVGKKIPDYAILSHTWGDDEVSFKDFQEPSCVHKKGYVKISTTCKKAREAGIKYAWIDTCCIDKSSSTQLNEAINSMYRWYQRSRLCYAYLSDLSPAATLEDDLANCRWFTRGWTLQELIAPKEILFLDQQWSVTCTKLEKAELLSTITGVNKDVLRNKLPLSSRSIAQRMSWVAARETTRIEDMAYCLLGIFDVNMPLIYGEEEKAFARLQEEILKTSTDPSIFAWMKDNRTENPGSVERIYCGVLAQSPRDFLECSTFLRPYSKGKPAISTYSDGIQIRTRLFLERIPETRASRYVLPVSWESWDPQDPLNRFRKTSLGIRLRKSWPGSFVREDPYGLVRDDSGEDYKGLSLSPQASTYLLTRSPETQGSRTSFISRIRSNVIQFQLPPEMSILSVWPLGYWDEEDQVFFNVGDADSACSGLRLYISKTVKVTGKNVKVRARCMFYALNWATDSRGPMATETQFSVFDYDPWAATLSEIQSQMPDHPHVPHALYLFKRYEVPKAQSAVLNIPDTKMSMLVSFNYTRVENRDICRNSFWRLEFSTTLL